MEVKTITENFNKLTHDFSFLSSQIKKMIEERLKVIINKEKRLNGGFEWVLEEPESKVTLRLYANGNLYIYKQDELNLEEKKQLGTVQDYPDLDSNLHGLELLYYLTDDGSIEEAIKALETFL